MKSESDNVKVRSESISGQGHGGNFHVKEVTTRGDLGFFWPARKRWNFLILLLGIWSPLHSALSLRNWFPNRSRAPIRSPRISRRTTDEVPESKMPIF